MMSHRTHRRGWLLYATGSVILVVMLLFVLCGCRTAGKAPADVRKESHLCRCEERPVLR